MIGIRLHFEERTLAEFATLAREAAARCPRCTSCKHHPNAHTASGCQHRRSPSARRGHADVIPRIQGGDDEASNLVVACAACNSKKSGRTPKQAGMTLRGDPQ